MIPDVMHATSVMHSNVAYILTDSMSLYLTNNSCSIFLLMKTSSHIPKFQKLPQIFLGASEYCKMEINALLKTSLLRFTKTGHYEPILT